MKQVVPWKALLKIIESHDLVADRERGAHSLEAMLRAHMMQDLRAEAQHLRVS